MDLKNKIEEGKSFSQALADHQQVFSELYINMVAAAEISGSLSNMLQKLAEYLDHEAETRSQVKGAMVYPIIIAVMAVLVTTFLLCFVLPRFTAIFAGKEHLLPKPTKILLAASAFVRNYWFLIVPAIGAALTGFWYFIGTEVGRLMVGQDETDGTAYKKAVQKPVHIKKPAHDGRAASRGCTHT